VGNRYCRVPTINGPPDPERAIDSVVCMPFSIYPVKFELTVTDFTCYLSDDGLIKPSF